MKNYLINYIAENSKIIKNLIIFLIIGILIGIIFFCILSEDIKCELINICSKTFDIAKEENFNKVNIIINGSIKYISILIIIYISSFLILGENISVVFVIIKGALLGIYSSIILNTFGIGNGMLSVLLLIIIPNIIYIPAFLYTLINSKRLNLNILCKNTSPKIVAREIINIVTSISLMFMSLVVEQSLCSIVINIWIGL